MNVILLSLFFPPFALCNSVAYGGVGLTPNGPTQLYRGFFGVYDGHGGQESAHWCATHVHEMLAICAAPPLPAMQPAPSRDPKGSVSSPSHQAANNAHVAVIPLSSVTPPTSSLGIPGQPESGHMGMGMGMGGSSHTPVLALSSPLMTLAPVSILNNDNDRGERKEMKVGSNDQPLLTIGSDGMKKLIERAFLRSEEEVLTAARRSGFKDGTCASVLVVAGDMLFCANVGDSRSVLCRDGQAIALSRDHKPHDPDEKKRIEGVGGSVHPVMRERPAVCCFKAAKVPYGADRLWPGGFSVSRALGDIDYKDLRRGKVKVVGTLIARPDVSVTSLTPYDRFAIVASDGLWDVMTSQEACDFVLRGIPHPPTHQSFHLLNI
jgi:serine/threonine protein phosphatase PrpC